MRLVSNLPGTGYIVAVDNYFTTVKLFRHLSDVMKMNAVGTARSNRLPKLIRRAKKDLAVGEFETASTADGLLTANVWRAKGLIYFLSSFHDHNASAGVLVERRSGAFAERIPSPAAAADYSAAMGGVDRADQRRSTYTVSRKSMRWWKALYFWMIDVVGVISFICMADLATKTGEEKITQLQFRKSLIGELLTHYGTDN